MITKQESMDWYVLLKIFPEISVGAQIPIPYLQMEMVRWPGKMNTLLILVNAKGDTEVTGNMVITCNMYSVTVNGISYADWYIPSK